MVVLCHSQQQAAHVKARLAEWLAPRGLAFNEDKTKIVHLSEGFDFLGFNVRRYPNRKLLIKPSQAALRRVRERLASEMRTLRGGIAMAIIGTLNPPHPELGGLLPGRDQTRLVHASCQRALHARQRGKPALQPAQPSRLA